MASTATRALVVGLAMVLASCTAGTSEPEPRASASESTSVPSPTNPFMGVAQDELDTRVLAAVRDGDAATTAQLLEAGADTEARDGSARTPLLLAVTADDVEVARVLVAAGADPDALDSQHDTPWLVTGVTGSVAMAEVLLPADPDLTIRNRFGGLSHIPASERGHDEYVAYVLDHTDIAVDHVNDLGWTALLEAVILGKGTEQWQHIVQSLVDHGADVSIADRDGVTPLRHARRHGFTKIADILERA